MPPALAAHTVEFDPALPEGLAVLAALGVWWLDSILKIRLTPWFGLGFLAIVFLAFLEPFDRYFGQIADSLALVARAAGKAQRDRAADRRHAPARGHDCRRSRPGISSGKMVNRRKRRTATRCTT